MTEPTIPLALFDTVRASLRGQLSRLFWQIEACPADGPTARRLYKMLHTLNNARMAAGEIGISRLFCLNDLLEGVGCAAAVLCAAQDLTLYTRLPRTPLYAVASPAALTIAALNLTVNAFEHSGCDAAQLSLSRAGHTGVITVRDKGRRPSSVAPPEGLGLAAVRAVCADCGGSLKITSGGGTAVSIALPLAACGGPPPDELYQPPLGFEYLIDRYSSVFTALTGMETRAVTQPDAQAQPRAPQ